MGFEIWLLVTNNKAIDEHNVGPMLSKKLTVVALSMWNTIKKLLFLHLLVIYSCIYSTQRVIVMCQWKNQQCQCFYINRYLYRFLFPIIIKYFYIVFSWEKPNLVKQTKSYWSFSKLPNFVRLIYKAKQKTFEAIGKNVSRNPLKNIDPNKALVIHIDEIWLLCLLDTTDKGKSASRFLPVVIEKCSGEVWGTPFKQINQKGTLFKRIPVSQKPNQVQLRLMIAENSKMKVSRHCKKKNITIQGAYTFRTALFLKPTLKNTQSSSGANNWKRKFKSKTH